MIKYLNHELIKISGTEFQIEYKCIKCNNDIFFNKKSNIYYQHNGEFWEFLKITCEEELIKKLLE